LKWAVEMTVKCSGKETVGVRANTMQRKRGCEDGETKRCNNNSHIWGEDLTKVIANGEDSPPQCVTVKHETLLDVCTTIR
jgi:hypothetical protein